MKTNKILEENLKNINNKEKSKLIENIVIQIINKSNIVNKISIFGSVARGSDNENSDIDFYIEFTEKSIDENFIYIDKVDEVIDIIENETFRKGGCDIVIKDDFCKYNKKFLENLRKDELVIYER